MQCFMNQANRYYIITHFAQQSLLCYFILISPPWTRKHTYLPSRAQYVSHEHTTMNVFTMYTSMCVIDAKLKNFDQNSYFTGFQQNFTNGQCLNSKNTNFDRKLMEDSEVLLIVKISSTFGAKCARKWGIFTVFTL